MNSKRNLYLRVVCKNFSVCLLSLGVAGTAHSALEITEIMYNPLTSGDHVWEWIEVRNTGGSPVDLNGYIGRSLGDDALQNPGPSIDSGLSVDTEIPAGGVGVIFSGNTPSGTAQDYDADLFRQAWGIDPNTPVIAAAFWPRLPNTMGSQGQSIGYWANDTNYFLDLDDPNGETVSFANAEFGIDFSSGFPTVSGAGGSSIVWSGIGSNQDGSQWAVSSSGASGAVTSVPIEIPGTLDDIGNPGLLPSGTAATGLHITEIFYNPSLLSLDEIDFEWIEVFNNTGAQIDFSSYVVDDGNNTGHSGPNISGTLDDDEVGILFNVDQTDPNAFAALWGSDLNLLPVTNWSAMGLNNGDSGDEVAIWDDFSSYDPNNPADHSGAIVTQIYGSNNGGFPNAGQGQSIYLAELGLDPNDGDNWVGALLGDDLSFNAAAADPNAATVFHEGGDEGSPGTVPSTTASNADFNGDGFVDGTDFLTWQLGFGTGTTQSEGDANEDSVVDGSDLIVWENQYGTAPLVAATGVVPEPAGLVLILAGSASLAYCRRP